MLHSTGESSITTKNLKCFLYAILGFFLVVVCCISVNQIIIYVKCPIIGIANAYI
jgi:hypothetical protein